MLTFSNAQSLIDKSKDEYPEDKEDKVGQDVDDDTANELYEILETIGELNDVHDFENHS